MAARRQVDALIHGLAGVSLGHSALDIDGALDGVDDAGELGQKPVAHRLEDSAAVRRDRRLNEFDAVSLLPRRRGSSAICAQPTAGVDVNRPFQTPLVT
jgi:hypothetical protein